jgi:KUP system potassium uptake protein
MVLGYFPNVTVHHTSEQTEGQIYIPEVNILLATGCLSLVLTFRESVKLAAAYGIAVTGTMTITSILFFIVVRYRWQWPLWKAVAVLVFFLSFDLPFLAANLFKFVEGGYVPVLIGASLIAAMLIWNRGRTFHEQKYATQFPSFEVAREKIRPCLTARVPGTAVFIASSIDHVPPILVHFVERCRSLQENVILLTVTTDERANVPSAERHQVQELGDGFWQMGLTFGFMDQPQVPEALTSAVENGHLQINLRDITYYVGHETLTAVKSTRLGKIAEMIFGYLQRNAVDVASTFCLPARQVIEIGTEVDL